MHTACAKRNSIEKFGLDCNDQDVTGAEFRVYAIKAAMAAISVRCFYANPALIASGSLHSIEPRCSCRVQSLSLSRPKNLITT